MRKLAYQNGHYSDRVKMGNSEDQRPLVERPTPANKLTDEECRAILEVIHQPEFKSLPPSQIVPILADQGIYIAS